MIYGYSSFPDPPLYVVTDALKKEKTCISTLVLIQPCLINGIITQFIKDEDGITVTIEDNGKGFDASRLHHFEGIGLKNMTSRIALIDGTMDIDTARGRGTLLAIFIPEK